MNIFYLDTNPFIAARYMCDKHVVKMIVESAQLLSTAHHVLDGKDAVSDIYAKAYENHPSAVWVRQSSQNYSWLFNHFIGLSIEYRARYKKEHACLKLRNLVNNPKNIPVGDFTNPPQCMPDQYKQANPVLAYRAYYIGEKLHFAKYKNMRVPHWIEKARQNEQA